ncbi:pectate lyase [Sphingobacterium alkalisoli]|uniref:Pectate lyase n=1 Tax=Sphingobacterium alkalisoli TaxID=1874115 RepID=A0A4U0H7L1_9SPHI|nr:pectate lyase [Sphingobacterium alkalisoli]TJY67741.1 pectate lyase [Sphingobacterium alkalisoli]GGH11657.1 pectate lyase [Sphingobacterium alkalisoli]
MKIFLSILLAALFGISTAQELTDPIAERMISYQLKNGGWPKQLADKSVVNYSKLLTPALQKVINRSTEKLATIDNNATTREINHLLLAYSKTNNSTYLDAATKGVQYILSAQNDKGGWPQYYPDSSSYRGQITYNDGAMINVLEILLSISTKQEPYTVLTDKFSGEIEPALTQGIDCILRTQVKQGNKATIWAAQYDQKTMEPAQARLFEPIALATAESAGILRFLMHIENPAPEIKNAITHAVEWFSTHKEVGYDYIKTEKNGKLIRELVTSPTSTIWARFYDVKTNQPIFGDRDNKVKYSLNEVSEERKNGYSWYGNWPQKVITREYEKWLNKVNR